LKSKSLKYQFKLVASFLKKLVWNERNEMSKIKKFKKKFLMLSHCLENKLMFKKKCNFEILINKKFKAVFLNDVFSSFKKLKDKILDRKFKFSEDGIIL
jgi:hypothetical protein